MKRTFLKVSLLSLLAVSMPISFVGCKDYDDDISSINETNDGLSKQLTSLQSALESYKEQVSTAQNAADAAAEAAREAASKGDKALADALAANTLAAQAEKAAAQAKADAIAEVINQLKPLVDANKGVSEKNAADIASLLLRVEGIEKGMLDSDALADVNEALKGLKGEDASLREAIDAVKNQISGVNSKITALEALKNQMVALETFNTEINKIKSQLGGISGLETKINGLQSSINTQTTNISNLTSRLQTLEGKETVSPTELTQKLDAISGEITTAVSGNLNTISGVICNRLTSVTLMPDLYIGGIPAIEFLSARYPELKMNSNGEWVPVTPSNNLVVTNGETSVEYRLNPATVNAKGIDLAGIKFVDRVAVARSGETENGLIKVVENSAKIENGILKLQLGKTTTGSLNLAGNKINTVALKVPVTSRFDNETNVNVYSEYNRLSETYFLPKLGRVPAEGVSVITDHFMDSTAAYNKADFDKNCITLVYNRKHDLFNIAEVCAEFANGTSVQHKAMTREEYQKYGFDIYFHVAAKDFNADDNTNQQLFASIDGSILTPVVPRGVSNNQAIIGRHPIIRATLYDTVNKKVVDQRYFKVLFTAEDMEDVKLDLPGAEATMGCDDMNDFITWREFQETVLETMSNKEGMSKADFVTIYGTTPTIECSLGKINSRINDTQDSNSAVFEWTITNAQVGAIKPGTDVSKVATITFKNADGLYPNVVLTWKFTIKVPQVNFALGKTDNIKWKNGNMLVYPVPMPSDYTATSGKTAYYDTNILEGRELPYVVNLWNCTKWDVNLAAGTPAGCSITLPDGKQHYSLTIDDAAGDKAIKNISFKIDNNANGVKLVDNGDPNSPNTKVTLTWNAYFNGYAAEANKVNIGTTTLEIVKPLTLTSDAGTITDNSREIKATLNCVLKDAYGNIVSNAANAEELAKKYYSYYGVTGIVWGKHYVNATGSTEPREIFVANTPDGAGKRSLASLNMTANVSATGELTFQNNGAPIQDNAYLIVPVSVQHKWGIINGTVAVKLNKKL